MPARARTLTLEGLYAALREEHGHLGWWPGGSADEIIIGAVLTQQAQWRNVETAIANLKVAGCISLPAIGRANSGDLERMVRPSGFYRRKAAVLKGFAAHVESRHGTLRRMLSMGAQALREELLSIRGIGPETADSVVLYAANKPAFVIDAYTRRIMCRMYGTDQGIGYSELQSYITSRISADVALYNDFHAQLVELGKRRCRTKPLCTGCPVKSYCLYGRGAKR